MFHAVWMLCEACRRDADGKTLRGRNIPYFFRAYNELAVAQVHLKAVRSPKQSRGPLLFCTSQSVLHDQMYGRSLVALLTHFLIMSLD